MEANILQNNSRRQNFYHGSVMDTGTDLQIRLEEATKTNDMEAIRPILRECYDFIADVIFEKQFTGQEYIDGMDARELLKITAQLLGSVTSGYDAIYSEQKKSNGTFISSSF